MKHLYGVFSPRGDLVAAFENFKAADAMARYDWKATGEQLYWSIAPQPATIGRILVEVILPEDRHRLLDEPLLHCSCFNCPRHPWEPSKK